MVRFFSDMARAVAGLFAPADSDLMAVGFQPITDDVYRREGSAYNDSDLDASVLVKR